MHQSNPIASKANGVFVIGLGFVGYSWTLSKLLLLQQLLPDLAYVLLLPITITAGIFPLIAMLYALQSAWQVSLDQIDQAEPAP